MPFARFQYLLLLITVAVAGSSATLPSCNETDFGNIEYCRISSRYRFQHLQHSHRLSSVPVQTGPHRRVPEEGLRATILPTRIAGILQEPVHSPVQYQRQRSGNHCSCAPSIDLPRFVDGVRKKEKQRKNFGIPI
ncbi:hypothetical protein JG687_00008229 [Phytophthora cactorum]|uniref:Secreted protein n=1 Tax=Phytophthora cactorum TaxID=29920 RepID=A0A8T1UD05_9STRA|nr:hypothetical protein JG687_00008229 [Phytophthora cactorum]